MRVCLLGNISVELHYSALQFILSVSFDARCHSSLQVGASATMILELNDSCDGKRDAGVQKANWFNILESCTGFVAFVENNNS